MPSLDLARTLFALFHYLFHYFKTHLKVLKLKKIDFESYAHRLLICDLESLEYRRALTDLRTTFKLLNCDYDLDDNLLFQPPYRRNLRLHSHAVFKPVFTPVSSHTLWNRVVNYWNCLPVSLNNVATPDAFTSFVQSLYPQHVRPDPVFNYFA